MKYTYYRQNKENGRVEQVSKDYMQYMLKQKSIDTWEMIYEMMIFSKEKVETGFSILWVEKEIELAENTIGHTVGGEQL